MPLASSHEDSKIEWLWFDMWILNVRIYQILDFPACKMMPWLCKKLRGSAVKHLTTGQVLEGTNKPLFYFFQNDVILTATPKVFIFQLPHRESNSQVGSFWLCSDWCYIVVLSSPNSNVGHKHLDSSHNRSIDQTLSLSASCMGGVSESRHGIKGVGPTGLFPANRVFS